MNAISQNNFAGRNDLGKPPLQENNVAGGDLSHGGNLIVSANEGNSVTEKTVSVVTPLRSSCNLPVFFTH